MQQDKTFLGTEPVGQLLRRLAIPTVIAQLVNMLYNIVDRIYIGHIPEVGSAALTGVGVCLPIILIVSAFACFTASGGAPRASIYMGRDDMDSAEKTLGGCFTLQIGISVVLTAVLLLWGRDALLAFGASENTIDYAADYLHIYAFGTLFVELTLGMNAFITAQGFAKVGMYTVLIGAAANIVLDPIFIFALGMGVRGAALATVLSQGALVRVGAGVSVREEGVFAPAAGKSLRLAQAHPAVRGARPRDVYDAGERERHLRVLQRFPAQVRRRHRRRRHDDPHERDAVCHAAAAGHRSGRAADHEL